MRHLLGILLVAPFFSTPAFGWGCEGHQIVALIARAHLTPAVSAAVDKILTASPIDSALTRFCKDRPNDLMADSATWADDAKSPEKTGIWHYVDIPRTAKAPATADPASVNPWCPPVGPSVDGKNRPGCITNALEYEISILKDTAQSAASRAMALRYVIHFLGDIHQPLHDEDNNDQGANCTAIQFFADEKPANLHAIWDYRLIQRKLEQTRQSQPDYARALDARFSTRFASFAAASPNDPVAWAWESHAIGESITYGALEPQIPVETPNPAVTCAAEREKVQALHITIGQDYFDKAMPAIDQLLATAGYRLAVLLNAIL